MRAEGDPARWTARRLRRRSCERDAAARRPRPSTSRRRPRPRKRSSRSTRAPPTRSPTPASRCSSARRWRARSSSWRPRSSPTSTGLLPRWLALAGFVVAAAPPVHDLLPAALPLARLGARLERHAHAAHRPRDGLALSRLARRAEADVEDVSVLDEVALPLQALQASARGLGVGAARDEVVPADHLGADEAVGEVRVDRFGRVERGQPAAERPRPRLLVTGREEADEIEGGEEPADDLLERGSSLAEGGGLAPRAARPAPPRASGRCPTEPFTTSSNGFVVSGLELGGNRLRKARRGLAARQDAPRAARARPPPRAVPARPTLPAWQRARAAARRARGRPG